MTEEYTSPGSYTYTVPSRVNTIRITANGAGGGGGAGGLNGGGDGTSGGDGGYAQGTLSVTPGKSYNVYIGGGGSGGFNNSGGSGGTSPWFSGGSGGGGDVSNPSVSEGGGGGGGGGATAFLDGTTALTVAEAGGGGSGGSYDAGEGGGGGGGARGGLGGDGGDGTDDSGSPGSDAEGTGSGGNGADQSDFGENGGSGGGFLESSLSSRTVTTGGGNNGGSGGAGGSTSQEDGDSGSSGSVLIEEAPPAPALTVFSFGNTSVTLDIGDTSNEDSVEVEYKETTNSTWITDQTFGSGVVPTTYTVSGLSEGVTYNFRVVVSNSIGSSDTQVSETTSLPAPTDISINTFTDTSATVTWNLQSVDEEGVRVYRSESGGSFTEIVDLSSGTESYQDTGLSNATEYEYYVEAYTQDVTSTSGTATVVTDLNNPQNLQDVSDTRNRIDVTWTSELNEGDFYIEYERLSDNTVQKSETVPYTTTSSFIDGVSDGVEYEVRVRAETSETTGPFTSIQTRVFIPHSRFTDIILNEYGDVEINWNKIDSFDGGVFELYRSETQGNLGSKIATFSDDKRKYIDDNTELSNDYYYTIRRVIG